jgi:probable DNA metabolism protein
MIYLYDESFDGFLTCVFLHYHQEKASGIAPLDRYQQGFLSATQIVETDREKAERVATAITTKISEWDLARIYRAFRSCAPEKEMLILRYLVLGFKLGSKIRLHHSHPVVVDVQCAEARLGTEVHRLCGLIRFSAMQASNEERTSASESQTSANREILYAPISPDNEVLEFLASHFCDRFKSEPFIIHDKPRGKALAAYRRTWSIVDFSEENRLMPSETEEGFQDLWRLYFDTIAIKERTNPKCQRNLMPVRYWKHLTEIHP